MTVFRAIAIIFLLTLVSTGSGLGAGPKQSMTFVAKYDDAFVQALERNVPVLLCVIQDGEAQNEQMVTECYSNRDFVKLCRMTVSLIGSRGSFDRHGTVDVEMDGRVRQICKKYGSVTCFEHQDVDLAAFRDFSKNGSIDTPHHYLIHPVDRRVIAEADDFIDRSGLMSMIRRAQREVGPGLGYDEYLDVKDKLAKVETHVKLKEYGAAAALLKAIVTIDAGGSLMEQAETELASINEIGEGIFAEAEAFGVAREYGSMYERLSVIQREFKSFKKLVKRISSLEKKFRTDPAAREAAKAFKLEPKARAQLDKAEKYLALKNHDAAIRALQGIVEKYAGTPSASNATKLLSKLEKDPAVGKLLAEHRMNTDCTKWLRLASKHKSNGELDKAREFYRMILEHYPESSYAKDAKEGLAEIP